MPVAIGGARLSLFLVVVLIAAAGLDVSVSSDFNFDRYLWEKRLVLARMTKPEWISLKSGLDSVRSAIDERQILFCVLIGGERALVYPSEEDREVLPEGWFRAIETRLGPDSDLCLVGLDGGIKALYKLETFSIEDLFARIDAMPMRKGELPRQNAE